MGEVFLLICIIKRNIRYDRNLKRKVDENFLIRDFRKRFYVEVVFEWL